MLSFPSYEDTLSQHSNCILVPDWVKRVKIDVGLSVNAPQSCIWLEEDAQLFVVGIEPSRSNLMSLLNPISCWQPKLDPILIDDRILVLPYAISNDPDYSCLRFTDVESVPGRSNKGMSSLKKVLDQSLVRRIMDVQSLKLSTIIKSIPVDRFPRIDHVKTDCQGSDFDVLSSASDQLSRVVFYTFEIESTTTYAFTENTYEHYHQFLMRHNFIPVRQAILTGLLSNHEIIACDDPTYINLSHIDYALTLTHRIFQKG